MDQTEEEPKMTEDTERPADAGEAIQSIETPEGAEGSGEPTAATGEAWRDVIAQLDALGDAMGRWARAAAGDPGHRERVREVKEHAQRMADSVGSAVDDAVTSDVGQQLRDAAGKAGVAVRQASERISDEVTPRMASAFRGAAEKLNQAAERVERKRAEEEAAAAAAATEESASETPSAGEPTQE